MKNRLALVTLVTLFACKTPQTQSSLNPPRPPDQAKASHEDHKATESDDTLHLTLVGTNDFHGWLEAATDIPGTGIRAGGVSALAGYVKILRDENPGGVLLFDAGDTFQGTLIANLSEGAAVVDAFNAVGYDAIALGNHEFDYGPEGAFSIASHPGDDPFGALKARIAQAKFPVLSTNIYDAETGARPEWLPGEGMTMIERKGVKIGVFGLTTPQTPSVTLPVNVASLRFGSLAPEALTASKRLREQGADIVVGIVHAGAKCSKWDDPTDLSSCDMSGEVFEMLKGLPAGTIDAVFSGHTHAFLGHFVNGTPVAQTTGIGRWFSTIDLYVAAKTKTLLKLRTRITPAIPICETVDAETGSCDPRVISTRTTLRAVPPTFHDQRVDNDLKVLQALEPSLRRVNQLQARKLGLKVSTPLGRDYENESPLGSFIADSLRNMEKADVALMNPGGLRADMKAGDITYGDVYQVMPFDNAISTLDLSGEQLRRLLVAAYGAKKGVFQVSGLNVILSRCPTSDRLKSVTLEGGKQIDANARYRVVLPDFLARGGDGLGPVLSTIDPNKVDLGSHRDLNIRDALVSWWQGKKDKFSPPRRGRVTFLADGDQCAPGSLVDGQTSQ
jgi:5'-nucleotidase